MAHAWFDLTAGVAGDMLLGSLIDAGANLDMVQQVVDAVVPGSVRLGTEQVIRGGQRATKLRVHVLVDDPPHRDWASIRTMLASAAIPAQTRQWASGAFNRLADAEARVHGTSSDEVHFHEAGALDSIADVVGTCEALRLLGVTSVSASPVALGSGRVRMAHGDIAVPVPAVAELSIGWRVIGTPGRSGHQPQHGSELHSSGHSSHQLSHTHHDLPAPVTTPGEVGELATPTGLALVRALTAVCEPVPGLAVTAVGVGAGSKDFPTHPNVVRVILGGPGSASQPDAPPTRVVELMANVDDLDPRLWPGVLEALLGAGAVDAWLVSIQMKKGRPGFTVHALAPHHASEAVATALLEHTTTLGVRQVGLERTVLERMWVDLEVAGQPLAVKIGARAGRVLHAAVEFESLAQVAAATGRPQAQIAQLAAAAIVEAGLTAGSPTPGDVRATR